MRIITTGDWHLGNLFHGNDRLQEHEHFLKWLKTTIIDKQPDALLVAGDVFDNGNPSAAAQKAYYDFLAGITQACPDLKVVITAGNHDSASRLEAPRPLLAINNVEIRGNIKRRWESDDADGGHWVFDFDDLLIPIQDKEGNKAVVIAVPYLRNDVIQKDSYSNGVNEILRNLTAAAREKHPGATVIMMAHMYAKGADISKDDASEKIVIGGQEEVNMSGWTDHPDYLACGHIHKRQQIWNTDWARYSGSVLPMSFAEKDYDHGVDLISFNKSGHAVVSFLEYKPQHKLRILPEDDKELTPKQMDKLLDSELRPRENGKLSDNFDYLLLKIKVEKFGNDEMAALNEHLAKMDAVVCKIKKIADGIDLSTIVGQQAITSIDDILDRDPMDTLKEAFTIKHDSEMTEHQEELLREIIDSINNQTEE
jgi:exonuclease SbcD